MAKHNWRPKVTKTSDCFIWLKEIESIGIGTFQFRTLPAHLQNISMLKRAAASELIKEVKIDNKGRKTWELNTFLVSRVETE